MSKQRKTIIGVAASHDNDLVNESLVDLFQRAREEKRLRKSCEKFYFLFTGGTYARVVDRSSLEAPHRDLPYEAIDDDTRTWLKSKCGVTPLPTSQRGGVAFLGTFIANRQCTIVWPFLSPVTTHWIMPENLALLRLCDQWRVKRLMTEGSVLEWLQHEADLDADLNRQEVPPRLWLYDNEHGLAQAEWEAELSGSQPDKALNWSKMRIALIAHDEMKSRMVEFAIDYERELQQVKEILTTGTTGREIIGAAPSLQRVVTRCQSGPKGGDIQIATSIQLGRCDAVFFFIDPLHAHPHIDDIRLVLGTCMAQRRVRMHTTEVRAREWMDRVVKTGKI